MSKLYGKVTGDAARTSATRRGHRNIDTWVQTEYGRITVILNDRGEYRVEMQAVYQRDTCGKAVVIGTGNVNTREAHPAPLYAPESKPQEENTIRLHDVQGIVHKDGIDEHGNAWTMFTVDYLAEQEPGECVICGAELEEGWMCLDGGNEVCASHVEIAE
jgi:hypothetical protein